MRSLCWFLVVIPSFSKWNEKKIWLNHLVYIFFSVSTSHLLVWNIWNPHFSIKRKVSNSICFSPGFSHPLLFATISVLKYCQPSSWSQSQMLSTPWDAICKVWRLSSNEGSRCFPTNSSYLDFSFILKIAYHSENSLPAKSKKGFGAYLALEELESCPASSSFPCCLLLEKLP